MEADSRNQANQGESGSAGAGFLSKISPWLSLLCIPGGLLWALSPIGVHLAELKLKSPELFWKLFPSAPLLLGLGLVGLYLRHDERHGLPAKLAQTGIFASLIGVVAILAGDAGLFYVELDEIYIMSAPAYRVFRAGLFVLAAGSLLLSLALVRDSTLSLLAGFPVIAGSVGGLLYSAQDLGSLGATLWTFFGLAWTWAGLVLLVKNLLPMLWRLIRS
jgi:hypothetical protein